MVNNIKIIRIRAGLTQKELSVLTGFGQSRISEYETLSSLGNITLSTLEKFSESLGVTINDLVYPLPETNDF